MSPGVQFSDGALCIKIPVQVEHSQMLPSPQTVPFPDHEQMAAAEDKKLHLKMPLYFSNEDWNYGIILCQLTVLHV